MNNDFGQKVIEKALLYAEHEWYASEKNVMHGIDDNGRYVDIPDITWKCIIDGLKRHMRIYGLSY